MVSVEESKEWKSRPTKPGYYWLRYPNGNGRNLVYVNHDMTGFMWHGSNALSPLDWCGVESEWKRLKEQSPGKNWTI